MMNRMKKLFVLLMAVVMLLAACGGEKSSPSEPNGDTVVEESTVETETTPQEQPVQADTWGSQYGMSGYVEYKYDEEGREIERLLINGATGTLHRRFVTTYDEDYGMPISETLTYGPNNILLYTVNQRYTEEGYPTWSTGYDQFLAKQTITQELSGSDYLYAKHQMIYDTGSEVLVFWIDHYGPNGLESRDYYWKDGTLYIQEFYTYTGDGSYTMRYKPLFGGDDQCIPEFNEQGQLIAYWKDRYDEEDFLRWSFEYDEEGRLTRRTRYEMDGEIERDTTLTYAEDGSLIQCSMLYGYLHSVFNYEDGFLVSRSGINNEIASMQYEYYPSGVVKTLICYDSYDLGSDFNCFYRFAEDGTLLAAGTYDYGMEENFMYDTRAVEFYNPDGTLAMEYRWEENTKTHEGIYVSREYIYDDANSKYPTVNRNREAYLDPIPAEDEMGFIMDLLNNY